MITVDCDKASNLMMLYADKRIKPMQRFALRKHVNACKTCREAFLAFDTMVEAYAGDLGALNVPDGFTPEGSMGDFVNRVMAKVRELPVYSHAADAGVIEESARFFNADRFLRIALSVFTVLMGAVFALMQNGLLSDAPLTGNAGRMAKLSEIAGQATAFVDFLADRLSQFLHLFGMQTNTLFSGATQITLIVITGLAVAFILIYKKEKAKV